ncbi:MAG: outer membrane protein [Chitinophagales bacterium]|nr:MAG: outer membrane protein [Chitinophagales bacterium]
MNLRQVISFLSLTLLCGSAFSQHDKISYASPGEYTIGGITVSGIEYLDPDIIISLSGLRVGDNITIPGDAVSNAIRNLWQQGLFTDIEIYMTKTVGNTVFLEISLKERPRLSRFTLRGIKKGEADDLREKIKLVKGRVVTENTKQTTVNTIKNFYREKGFLNVTVTIREIRDTLLVNSVMLDIEINKGAKVKIESITFKGNEVVSTGKLKRLMKGTRERVKFDLAALLNRRNIRAAVPPGTSLHDVLANLSVIKLYDYVSEHANLNFFKASKYLEKEYRNDKNNIIAHYNSKGFRDAKIVRDSVYLAGKSLRIDIELDEGRQYYFGDITWKGNTKYTSSYLSELLNIQKGDIYNQKLLEERLYMSASGNDISSLYMDNGYLFFQITPVEMNVHNDTIDLELRIYEGPQATINEVRIYGNTKTKEHVIRRELRTLPGSKFSRADLIRSQREIATLGYFDPEQLNVVPIPDPARGTVDIEYHVVEKPSDQLELSAGWGGTANSIVGSLGIVFTNFSIQNLFKKGTWSPLPSGDGQKLSLRIQTNGKIYQSYSFSFTEPWLGGKKPNSFTVSYHHTRQDYSGRQITNGATVGIGTRLKWPDDFFTFHTYVEYERFVLENRSLFEVRDGTFNNLGVQFILARNSVDQPIFPRSGSSFSLSLKITPPYSLIRGGRFSPKNQEVITDQERFEWVEYHKWRFQAEWYTTLIKSQKTPLVLRFSAKFGFLGKYNKKIGFSPFERFQLGGDGISNFQTYGVDVISLRGYDVFADNAPFYDKFTMELRFPFSLNPSATIYALAFLEGGNAWSNIRNFNPFDIRRSAGLGIRIFLPMFGMLGFDYGIGFDKSAGKATDFGDYLSKYGKFSIVLGFEPE